MISISNEYLLSGIKLWTKIHLVSHTTNATVYMPVNLSPPSTQFSFYENSLRRTEQLNYFFYNKKNVKIPYPRAKKEEKPRPPHDEPAQNELPRTVYVLPAKLSAMLLALRSGEMLHVARLAHDAAVLPDAAMSAALHHRAAATALRRPEAGHLQAAHDHRSPCGARLAHLSRPENRVRATSGHRAAHHLLQPGGARSEDCLHHTRDAQPTGLLYWALGAGAA